MEFDVDLPTFHPGQLAAYRLKEDPRADPASPLYDEAWRKNAGGRFKAVRCGRRWGKTDYAKIIACDAVIKGKSVFWGAPDYKIMSEAFNEIVNAIEPIKKSSSKIDGIIRTITGGRIDFWTLENSRAGRSRKYHGAIIDEGAFTKPEMIDTWNKSIMPTLLDYKGWALVLSNTNGTAPDNFMWQICNQPEHGFIEYHAPTAQNPYLPADEIERLKRDTPPLVFAQEYLAEFVDWAGEAFFGQDNMMGDDGLPVEYPARCDMVFATIDTAVKTGKENDGTAVIYWGANRAYGYPLIALDYDIVQIEGSLLEAWLPNVYRRLDDLALECGSRAGSLGTFIEDKASGMVLLQQAARRGWLATAIDSVLTSVGKDERAISVSGYVYQGKVKMSMHVFNKLVNYKGQTRNHFMSQVFGYRVGQKDANDDLTDCFTYGIAIALGDSGGI